VTWSWIAVTLGVPALAGLIAAVTFWFVQRDATFGNVVGAGVIAQSGPWASSTSLRCF
jgi:hypothetical protein